MADDALNAGALSLGVIVSVRGSVVDIRFHEGLPPIYSVLRAGEKNQIVIEVLAHLDTQRVRGIALMPTQGLARGMAVEDTGGPLKAPVGHSIAVAVALIEAETTRSKWVQDCPCGYSNKT
jgi:F-type H+-transporting ATPase subunit beta